MIRILIGGDICPMGRVQSVFAAGTAVDIFGDLLPAIRSADISIANLECPLISMPSPINKAGPILQASRECINGFVEAGWDILNLANNHSFDHGAAGLQETMCAIRDAGLMSVGAGANLAEAQAPLILQINGRRVVIYSMAEREFSVADEMSPGANPLDLISFVHAVRFHKQGGLFITLVHGGKEYYPYPTPEMIRRCRFMVDMGADAVICCHTHCPLPWEMYAGCPIVYGLGNLIFEPLAEEAETWHQGYMAQLEFSGVEVRLRTIPYEQCVGSTGTKAMDEAGAVVFHQELQKRSAELLDPALLKLRWKAFCRQKRTAYLSSLFAYNSTMRRVGRFLLPRLHSKEAVLQSLLLVQCETHREVLESLFCDESQGHENGHNQDR